MRLPGLNTLLRRLGNFDMIRMYVRYALKWFRIACLTDAFKAGIHLFLQRRFYSFVGFFLHDCVFKGVVTS